jgi:hypothetical protein
VTVPPSIHRRYRWNEALPLYQMIAKNVGIRRATGDYILATNIDILLSHELMSFIAGRRLEAGKMYRVDRYDVAPDVPLDAPLDEQLSYCRTHCLRLNACEGTFPLTSEGFRALAEEDITAPENGIFFGRGWYAAEQHFGEILRRVKGAAEVLVRPSERSRVLRLDMAPRLGSRDADCTLNMVDSSGNALGEALVRGPSTIRMQVPAGMTALDLRLTARGQRIAGERALDFQAFRCGWDASDLPEGRALDVGQHHRRTLARTWQAVRGGSKLILQARHGARPRSIGLPVSPHLLERLRLRSTRRGLAISVGTRAADRPPPNVIPADLHTNACGDFTLAHREHWMELRGYPEFDLYSMNIDSVLCYMAHYGGAREHVLTDPMRIYHIEHARGSGWTPEGEDALFQRLTAQEIPWLAFEQVLDWAAQMERFQSTMVFNRDNWGLAAFDLEESEPCGA